MRKYKSATAIYGNRGSNGVILVTTKKGAKGALKVSVGTTFTVNFSTGAQYGCIRMSVATYA